MAHRITTTPEIENSNDFVNRVRRLLKPLHKTIDEAEKRVKETMFDTEIENIVPDIYDIFYDATKPKTTYTSLTGDFDGSTGVDVINSLDDILKAYNKAFKAVKLDDKKLLKHFGKDYQEEIEDYTAVREQSFQAIIKMLERIIDQIDNSKYFQDLSTRKKKSNICKKCSGVKPNLEDQYQKVRAIDIFKDADDNTPDLKEQYRKIHILVEEITRIDNLNKKHLLNFANEVGVYELPTVKELKAITLAGMFIATTGVDVAHIRKMFDAETTEQVMNQLPDLKTSVDSAIDKLPNRRKAIFRYLKNSTDLDYFDFIDELAEYIKQVESNYKDFLLTLGAIK